MTVEMAERLKAKRSSTPASMAAARECGISFISRANSPVSRTAG
jgi:hypothetical protein